MMRTWIKNNKTFLFVLIFILVIGGAYSIYRKSRSQIGVPFGGFVVMSEPCPCSENFLLTFAPFFLGGAASGGVQLTFRPPQLFLNNNLGFMTGVWALGTFTPMPLSCQIPSGKSGCQPYGTPLGEINPFMVGSSLTF